jgi:fermentation-respiration switch protein FrsA (DUF1100 family)
MKTAVLLALALAVLAGALRLLVTRLEPRAAFFPFRGEQQTPEDLGVVFERVALKTEDGETVTAWWLPAGAGAPEVLFFHGNGGNLSVWSDVIVGIRRQGWTVFALDYRGYGLSSGRPTERGIYKDADALVADFWARRHHTGSRAIYWGRSLGATVAAYAASKRRPDAVVLESPLHSARTLVSSNPVTWLLGFFMSYRFETSRWMSRYPGPTLVIHGERDDIIPLGHGRRVYEALSGTKEMVVIAEASHNDLHLADPDRYWLRLRRFILQTAE